MLLRPPARDLFGLVRLPLALTLTLTAATISSRPLGHVPPMAQAEALGNLEKDINVAVRAAKVGLARPHGVHRHVRQRVDALRLARWQGTVDDEAVRPVRGVDVVRAVGPAAGRRARSLADAVLLAVVRVGAGTGREDVPRVPVEREVGPGAVADAGLGLGVLRETRVLVDTDSVALGALVRLLVEVLGIRAAKDVCADTPPC